MDSIGPMLLAMTISTFNFLVVLMNLEFRERLSAKLFASLNFVLGVMNMAVAIKYMIHV